MKLYRGLKTEDFRFVSPKQTKDSQRDWAQLLEKRSKGDFTFPKPHSSLVNKLHREGRYLRQHFTDDREIAERYAKSNKGTLLELDVPLKEIAKRFHLEFQNFAHRSKKFEIVYVIESSALSKNAKKWKLKLTTFGAKT
ncbi:MAG: hypothetical protein AAB250_11045 [Bdellovibrionota bacterium]